MKIASNNFWRILIFVAVCAGFFFAARLIAHKWHLAIPYWLPSAAVGSLFTLIGLLKVYGLIRGVVGGRDKPLFQYACGTCPTWMGRTWRGRLLRYGLPFLFLGIGIWALTELALEIYAHRHG